MFRIFFPAAQIGTWATLVGDAGELGGGRDKERVGRFFERSHGEGIEGLWGGRSKAQINVFVVDVCFVVCLSWYVGKRTQQQQQLFTAVVVLYVVR